MYICKHSYNDRAPANIAYARMALNINHFFNVTMQTLKNEGGGKKSVALKWHSVHSHLIIYAETLFHLDIHSLAVACSYHCAGIFGRHLLDIAHHGGIQHG